MSLKKQYADLNTLSAKFIGVGQHSLWHGNGFHNVVLSFEALVPFSKKDVHELGDVKLTIYYGTKKNQVTIKITSNAKRGKRREIIPCLFLLIAIKEAKALISQILSNIPNDDEIDVRCFELHQGFVSLRLEGINNLHLLDFMTFIYRVARSKKPTREE